MLFSFFCTLFRQYDDCEKRNKHTCRYVKNGDVRPEALKYQKIVKYD